MEIENEWTSTCYGLISIDEKPSRKDEFGFFNSVKILAEPLKILWHWQKINIKQVCKQEKVSGDFFLLSLKNPFYSPFNQSWIAKENQ